jgi:hypothetical protein
MEEDDFVPAHAFLTLCYFVRIYKAKNKGLTLQVWLESCMDAKQMT